MHFHHRHDIAGCTTDHHDWPDWATTILATLDRMELQIMTATQDSIDAAATVIGELVDRINVLEANSQPPADTSSLDAAVASAKAVLPAPAPAPEPAPAPAAPAETPAAPAEQPAPADSPAPADQPAASDGTVPVQSVPSVPLA